MFCEPVQIDELIQLISNLNNNKGSGPDNIGPRLLKEMTPVIIQPFLYIINLSLSTGVFTRKVIILFPKIIALFQFCPYFIKLLKK